MCPPVMPCQLLAAMGATAAAAAVADDRGGRRAEEGIPADLAIGGDRDNLRVVCVGEETSTENVGLQKEG